MAAQGKLVITKRFTYEGFAKEYVNTYHFLGGAPTDFATWSSFATAVIDQEKTIFASSTHIVGAEGWDSTHTYPVYTETFDVAGTLTATGASSAPGDCAAVLRYATAARDSKNRPIYGYNYYHGCIDYDSGSGHPDGLLYTPQKAAIEAYGAAWVAAIDGHQRCTPKGEEATDVFVDQWIRHRDFPR